MAKAWFFVYDVDHMQRSKDQAGAGAELWGDEGFPAAKWEDEMTFWRLQVGGWGAVGTLAVLGRFTGLLPDFLPVSGIVFYIALGFVVTSAFRPVFRRVFESRKSPPITVFLMVGLAAVVVAVFEALALLWCHLIYGDAFLYSRTLRGAGVVNHLLVLGSWLVLYFLIKQKRLTRALERESREAALKLLRYQVNPHFLFNALNSIAAHAADPQKVTLGVEALADYLRFSLDQNRSKHPLGEELDAMDNYLTVEKIRFEDKLDYTIEADEEARRQPAPPAIVQPLVENAMKYGSAAASGPLVIRIQATRSPRETCLAVENSGPWVSRVPGHSLGTGLSNLRNRLKLVYGARAALTVERHEDHVRVAVNIPADDTDR